MRKVKVKKSRLRLVGWLRAVKVEVKVKVGGLRLVWLQAWRKIVVLTCCQTLSIRVNG